MSNILSKLVNNKQYTNLAVRIGFGIAAALGLAGISGCEGTLSEGDIFNASMQGYGMRSGTVEGAQSGAILGNLGKTAADRQHDLDVAREGRTEINISNNSNTQDTDKLWVFRTFEQDYKDNPDRTYVFIIKTNSTNPNDNRTGYFGGKILKIDAEGYTMRAGKGYGSDSVLYYLPKKDIIKYAGYETK